MDGHIVKLDRDHPGFRDPIYRRRRDEIAHQAELHAAGDPPPDVAYTDDEHQVWRAALTALAPLHARYACASYRAGFAELALPRERVPQLRDVGAQLSAMTGFRYEPVAGLVTPRFFMERLEHSVFLSTQYMRHHSMPLYTPEPDVIHEIVGHAPLLATRRQAELNRLFGQATKRVDDAQVERLIRLYWYGLEFGLAYEDGGIKAVGAGLLSSFGELGRFEASAKLLPFDVDVIASTPFDPTAYQSTLFVAESEDALLSGLARALEPLVHD